MKKSEDELISSLQNSRTRNIAFGELLRVYQERLYWTIRRIVLSHDDADDVLQETFIKIYKNIDQFKGDSQLYSWMYRIATNEALSFLKRRAKIQGISETQLQEKMISNLEADPFFEGDKIQKLLQEGISKLPEKQRLVFNMKYFDEMTYEEMSGILETSIGALKASYHHAVKKLEVFLQEMNSQ
jgi:RNA polymerase sigma-70 factor (ECF subfamily)